MRAIGLLAPRTGHASNVSVCLAARCMAAERNKSCPANSRQPMIRVASLVSRLYSDLMTATSGRLLCKLANP
jgi:hypothetical protein